MPVDRIELPAKMYQNCPLCQWPQPMYVRGHYHDVQDQGKIHISYEHGYSFCNCWNIFYTDWNNIDKRVYDEDYQAKYSQAAPYMDAYADKYLPMVNTKGKEFLEIGYANLRLLDRAKEAGWNTSGINLVDPPQSPHDLRNGDFTQITDEVFDFIWMSHTFEHLKNPEIAMIRLRNLQPKGGHLFIAMPDPFFINWADPTNSWQHWHVREHHILWDMDSFIEFASLYGYKCVYKFRNGGGKFICDGDYHLLFEAV